MLLDAREIFNKNADDYITAMETPKSAEDFHKKFINPAIEASREDGFELEAAFGSAIADYQRNGFYAGFDAAVQHLLGCLPVLMGWMPDDKTKE